MTRCAQHIRRGARRWPVLLLLLVLAGCGGDRSWRLMNISGLMPTLQFTLTDAGTGHTVHGEDFRGRLVLLYFGYTHCPDVCPTTLAQLGAAARRLGNAQDQVRILFVSVDPARDTVEVLRRYGAAFGPSVVALRGDQRQLRALTKRYRVTYGYGKPDGRGRYEVSHSSAVYVFDRGGRARLLGKGSDDVDAFVHDLRQLAAERS